MKPRVQMEMSRLDRDLITELEMMGSEEDGYNDVDYALAKECAYELNAFEAQFNYTLEVIDSDGRLVATHNLTP